MSIRDRLQKKTGDLLTPPSGPERLESSIEPVRLEARAPQTGPGQMLAFRTHMRENNLRVEELENQLKTFEGSKPVRLVDPRLVHPSKWANRHESTFESAQFESLKDEIANAGVNIQAISVRPRAGAPGTFEIIFGHRRHRACLMLGFFVAVTVEDEVDDRLLFASMDRENRNRADLSPFEQGDMYRRALDDGLFTSLRQMCTELGIDAGNASKAISIARLPAPVLAAFAAPIQIQYRWGSKLSHALLKDPEGVLTRAQTIHTLEEPLQPAEAFAYLVGGVASAKEDITELERDGTVFGKVVRKTDGSISCTIISGVIQDGAFDDFLAALLKLLSKNKN